MLSSARQRRQGASRPQRRTALVAACVLLLTLPLFRVIPGMAGDRSPVWPHGVVRIYDASGMHGDVATAEDLARRIGAALENARLFGEARAAADAQRRIAEREAFYARLGEAVAETLDVRETLDAAAGLLVPPYADWALVNLIDENGALYLAASHHRDPEHDAALRDLLDMRYIAADARPIDVL